MTNPRTTDELVAAIRRNEVNALDSRFDAQMRAMFRRSVASLRRELGAPAANLVAA
ncbi:hypothetical protein [Sphingobium sp. YR768]|uniref:hypothetical protein n=1 Tax=Sphingobium sp. YR768 TaxID=1884365 RepID=UPI0008C2176E|nr:hypothetical protein [Sphingobium sp. YR768]SES08052.1 hypothetical protein SAMN05518866_13713 [Sphingobium sp. YR768]